MWPPSEQDREREDAIMKASDRRLVRLACKVVASYAGVDEHTAWITANRLKALKRAGASDHDMLERLRP